MDLRPLALAAFGILSLAASSAQAQTTPATPDATPRDEPATGGKLDKKLEAIIGNTPENRLPPKMLPKWELGVGFGAFSLPDYRGANHQTSYALPLPYGIYRGKFLRADRSGVTGRLFDSERLDVELSGGGGVPVSSKNNEARQGMPNLKPTLEFGPQAIIRIVGKARDVTRLDVRLPVRQAITASFTNARTVGWVFTPALNLSIEPRDGWHFGAQAGLYYATSEYHRYFYDVAPQYATATRPAYSAKGGYGGWQGTTSLSRSFGKVRFTSYARISSVNGAVFDGSPLVKRKTNLQGGFAISWLFTQSSEMVEATDDE